MTTTSHPLETYLSPAALAELLEQIFPALLTGYEEYPTLILDPLESKRRHNVLPSQGTLTARVGLHGAWEGVIAVTSTPAVAEALAERMLQEPQPTEEDRDDAIGEVANVIAGNVKGMLPGDNRLGLPRVEETSPFGLEHLVSKGCINCRECSVYVSLAIGLIIVQVLLGESTGEQNGGAA